MIFCFRGLKDNYLCVAAPLRLLLLIRPRTEGSVSATGRRPLLRFVPSTKIRACFSPFGRTQKNLFSCFCAFVAYRIINVVSLRHCGLTALIERRPIAEEGDAGSKAGMNCA